MFDNNAPKIIYFTADTQVTAAEAMDMLNYGSNVQVRNARYIGENDGREECDGVAGSVPQIYASAPTGQDALDAYKVKIAARMALVGDSAAPEPAGQHAVRLMGKSTAPGPDDIKELPPAAASADTASAETNSAPAIDPAAPPVEVPAPATGKATKAATAAAAKGWQAGQ